MLMLTFRIHELGIHLQDPIQGEGLDVDQFLGIDLAVLSSNDLHGTVDLFHFGFHFTEFHVIHQVRFVQNDPIGKGNLLHALIFHAFRFLLFQMFGDVFGIHNGDNTIQFVGLLDLIIHKEGLGHRSRIRQAGGFNDDTIDVVQFAAQTFQDLHQITTHRAADTAIHHLDDLLLGVLFDDVFIHPNLAEFILDDGEFHTMVWGFQNVVQQCCLARTKKPCEHGHRHNF
mmetsp:Transcript_10163/g.17448  ORF Transcript_10163/g.17448 Transcript_10163/m.17448 type:complete len:228 (-) Transcript_10163:69-752(-)